MWFQEVTLNYSDGHDHHNLDDEAEGWEVGGCPTERQWKQPGKYSELPGFVPERCQERPLLRLLDNKVLHIKCLPQQLAQGRPALSIVVVG